MSANQSPASCFALFQSAASFEMQKIFKAAIGTVNVYYCFVIDQECSEKSLSIISKKYLLYERLYEYIYIFVESFHKAFCSHLKKLCQEFLAGFMFHVLHGGTEIQGIFA